MKKYMWLLCVVAMVGCESRPIDTLSKASSNKIQLSELGEQFELPIGQTVTFEKEGLSIRFESVPMDCRCPADVLCIWAGYASMVLKANELNHEADITLSTATLAEQTASFFSYTVELVELTPYPISDQQTDPTAYKAVLIVKKSGAVEMPQSDGEYK